MPAPRQSYTAEAAKAAAEQAEFNEKKWVWVPDEAVGYIAGYVHKEDGEMGEIVIRESGEVSSVSARSTGNANISTSRFAPYRCTHCPR